ncbi:hypothetical protein D3C73_946760 [compost metagenome]
MQIMKIKSMYLMVLTLVTLAFVGCSKDEDNTPSDGKGKVKLTVTTSSSFDKTKGANIQVSVGSHDGNANPQKWKVNGQELAAKTVYMYSEDDFQGGKTFTFESLDSYLGASASITAMTTGAAYTLTYKIEEGGKVHDEGTVEVRSGNNPVSLPWNFSNYGK